MHLNSKCRDTHVEKHGTVTFFAGWVGATTKIVINQSINQ